MADDDTTNEHIEGKDNVGAVLVKRRLRAEPQTMRQRNEKRQNTPPKQRGPVARALAAFWFGFSWPVRALGRQIAKLQRFKVFRIIGYILLPPYIRGSWRELRQVSWPDFRQSWRLTYAVLIFSILFGIVIAILDFGLDKLFKEIFTK